MTAYNGEVVGENVAAWRALDTIVRGWIVKSQFDNDLSNYQKLKEQYE